MSAAPPAALSTSDVIAIASKHLVGLRGHEFDVLEVAKPVSPPAAINLAKIISKLSPLVGRTSSSSTPASISTSFKTSKDGAAGDVRIPVSPIHFLKAR